MLLEIWIFFFLLLNGSNYVYKYICLNQKSDSCCCYRSCNTTLKGNSQIPNLIPWNLTNTLDLWSSKILDLDLWVLACFLCVPTHIFFVAHSWLITSFPSCIDVVLYFFRVFWQALWLANPARISFLYCLQCSTDSTVLGKTLFPVIWAFIFM